MTEAQLKQLEKATLLKLKEKGIRLGSNWEKAASYKSCEIKTADKDGTWAYQIFKQGEGHVVNSGLKFKSEDEAISEAKKYIDQKIK